MRTPWLFITLFFLHSVAEAEVLQRGWCYITTSNEIARNLTGNPQATGKNLFKWKITKGAGGLREIWTAFNGGDFRLNDDRDSSYFERDGGQLSILYKGNGISYSFIVGEWDKEDKPPTFNMVIPGADVNIVAAKIFYYKTVNDVLTTVTKYAPSKHDFDAEGSTCSGCVVS